MRNFICSIFAAASLLVTWNATTACYPRFCDPTSSTTSDGRAIDNNTWESVSLDEPWYSFPGARTVDFQLPQFKTRRVVSVEPYVAFSQFLNNGGDDFTLGSGDITEVLLAKDGIVRIRNGSCANLYIRVVVRFAPDDRASIPDAGPPESTLDGAILLPDAQADADATP